MLGPLPQRLPPMHAKLNLLLALSLAASLLATPGVSAERPPNFIVILVDDLGWMDLSCQGSEYYRTPSIDRLAQEGMRFTNAYAACAVCSPTRAALQTGRYPGRTGVTDWIRSRFQRGGIGTPDANPTEYVGGRKRKLLCPPNPFWLDQSEVTIAELLRTKGYKTAHIGKWHLGDDAWYPTEQGYDVNRGGCDYGQPPSYFDPFHQPRHRHPMIRAGIPHLPGRSPGQFLTHREGEEAVALIERWKDQPFFLHLAHYAVHTPIQALPEAAAKYRQEGKTEVNAKYAAMVESVDDACRDIIAKLRDLELLDDTVILFTSDNGGLDNGGRPTDNAPLRSGKGHPYEGGIRVPLIVRWPAVTRPGTLSDEPVCSIDVLPTLAVGAGLQLEQGAPYKGDVVQLDGLPLNALLSGKAEKLPRQNLIWHFPHYRHRPGPYSIIRQGPWKLIKFYEGPRELYNLDQDLGEANNLAAERPDQVASLEQALMTELQQMGALLPIPNPDFAP